MSYILDALRKSDQQRQRGAAPTLPAVQPTALAPKQPVFLTYGLLMVVLVTAGVFIGWLRPWQTEQAPPARPLESLPHQATTALSASPQVAPRSQPELQAQNAPPPVQAAPARVKTGTDVTTRKANAAVSGKSAVPPPRQAPAAAADAARLPMVVSMAELPPAIQQEIPAMTISVHAYSAVPKDRMVGINSQILREDAYVVPGLKLEQITPEGMVFGYKGYSFRRSVK